MYFQLIQKTIIQLIVENSLYKHGPIIPLRGYDWTQILCKFSYDDVDVVDLVVDDVLKPFMLLILFCCCC